MKETPHSGRYWLTSGLLSMLQNFSGVFFGFAGFYLLVRILGKEEYGAWVLFMSVVTIIEAVRIGLLHTALVRYLSMSEPEKHPRIIGASLLLSGAVTVLCVALNLLFAGYLASLWKTPYLKQLFYTYNIVFLITGFLNIFNCIEQANLKFGGPFITGLIRQSCFFLFIAVAYLTGYRISLVELVWTQALGALLATCVAYVYVRPYLQFTFQEVGDWVRRLFGYGKYGFGTFVGSLLSATVDQMMLGALLSPAASGAFNIAVRITNLIDIPMNAMAAIVFPQSAKRMASEGVEAVRYLYERSVGITLAILLPGVMFLYFFSDLVISLIAGERYADSASLLKITLLYCLLIPFGRQFGTILDSIGKTKITFMVVLFTMVCNLTLNYFFIKEWGVMGAAYATLVSNVIGFVIGQRILKKLVGVNLLHVAIYMYRFYPDFLKTYVRPWFARVILKK